MAFTLCTRNRLTRCGRSSTQYLVCSEDEASADQYPSQLRDLKMKAKESCCKA